MKTCVELNNMSFFAYHGVLEDETINGNDFTVSVRFSADLLEACVSDDVSDTVNYSDVYDVVKLEMSIPSKLLENVAYRILQRVKSMFPKIEWLEVRVAKKNPPVDGKMECSAVIVSD